MRILIIASWYPTKTCPEAGIFVAEQAEALSRRHEVRVLVPETIPSGSAPLRAVETGFGFSVVRIAVPARGALHWLDQARTVARETRTFRPDVLHGHVTLPGGLAAVLAGKVTRRPAVITEHMGPFDRLMKTVRDRIKVRFALNRAAAVVAVSRGLESRMRHFGIRRPIEVVPNVVHPERFCPRAKPPRGEGEREILFVGRLNDRYKNLPGLLRALAILLRTNGHSYRLRIAGDGCLRAQYERMASELGILERCSFVGALDRDGVASALAACDVFVLPSVHENCPVTVIEALASGRPIVVTRCGGSEEMVTPENGRAVPVDDPQALAGAIREICTDLHRYQPERIAQEAHSLYGAPAIVGRLTAIYESVCAR